MIPARLLTSGCVASWVAKSWTHARWTLFSSSRPFTTAEHVLQDLNSVPTQQHRDLQELNDFFPVIKDSVREALRPYRIESETEWLIKVLEYNTNKVRCPGALCTLNAMRELSSDFSPEILRKAKFLGWCNELVSIGSYITTDDMIDGTTVRWDKPTWHALPRVGLAAINDAFLVEGVVYHLLRQQFKGSPCYEELVDLLATTTVAFYLGQNDDVHGASHGRALSDDFTTASHDNTARLKTSLTTYYNPVASALLADDYTDCFGKDPQDWPAVDIRNGKCSWMILEAKRIANEKQLKVLKENYGYDDDSKVDAVKEVFMQLGLKERVMNHRRDRVRQIQAKIEHNAHVLPPNIYQYSLETLEHNVIEYYERNKVE